MKNKYLTLAISMILSLAIIFNSASFHKDTYALIPAFAGVAAAASGGAAVSVSSEAVAVLVGIVAAGLGIVVGSSDEGQALVDDFITNICKDKSADEVASTFEGFGFDCTVTDGSCAVDVKNTKKTGITVSPDGRVGYENVINVNFGEYTEPTGDGGGSGDPDNNNDNKANKIAGYLMAASSLFSIGKEFYNFLHNSDSVHFISDYSTCTGNGMDIYLDYYKNIYEIANSYFGTSLNTDAHNVYSDDILFASASEIEQYDTVYCFCTDSYNYPYPYNRCGFSFPIIYYNSTTSDYRYYDAPFSYDYDNKWSDFPIAGFSGNGSLSFLLNSDLFTYYSIPLDGNRFSINNSRYGIKPFRTYFVNSSSSELTGSSSVESLSIGEDNFKLSNDNIYKNPDFLNNAITPYTNSDNDVFCVVPQVNASTHGIVYPGGNPFINTDSIDPVLDPDISEDTHNNQNIFTLLENFIKNFFAKLGTLLKSLFVPDFSSLVNQFSSLKDKFPIISQVDTLVDKLINFNYSKAPPDFKISYNSETLGYTSEKISFFNYKIFDDYLSILHSIILFVSYFFFCKKVLIKITKIFQP